ncbi:GDSL-type esterase/lipase family protein [Candidatus Pseudothioglobus singularis]|nr:GDSL-type esterase/lipase family protein [Candidatus Pseudothioglobus singularis]
MNWINKNTFFSLLLSLSSVLLTFIVLEFSLRIFDIGYGNAPLESSPTLHHSHPVNYKFQSHNPAEEYGGHMIYYDEEGLSSAKPSKSKNHVNDSCRIAFLGDSFTEAGQVDYEKSFVGQLDSQTNCIVKNFGVSSYSPIMYLLQWSIIESSFNPTHVFVQLFSNDMDDDKSYYAMATKDESGRVIAIPGPGGDWLRKQLRKSYLNSFVRKMQLKLTWIYQNYEVDRKKIVSGTVEEDPNITDLSRSFIKKLNDKVVLSGSNFILFVVPSKYRSVTKNYDDGVEFSDKWKKFSEENGVEFVDLVKEFKRESLSGAKLFFDKDIHFNEFGHDVVADVISNQYSRLFK